MSLNYALFFAAIRASLFGGALTQAQVDGIGRILDGFNRYGTRDRRHLAYILATAYRETGRRMVPVREGFATTDAGARAAVAKLYRDGKISRNYALPNAAGKSFYGRGPVQLTFEDNYRKMGQILGLDLVGNPDLVLNPEIGARILVEGMLRAVSLKGDFSGKALEDYIYGDHCDYPGARHTVNGTDHAAEIAANAVKFEAGLIAGGATAILMPAEPPPASNDNTKPPTKPASSGLFAAASAAIGGLFRRS